MSIKSRKRARRAKRNNAHLAESVTLPESWQELIALGSERGVYRVGMNKAALLAALGA